MNINILIAIAGIMIAAIIAYHIAFRQGIFRRTRLFTTVYFPEFKEEIKRHTWLVIDCIPPINVDYYVLLLPYIFQNRCKIPLKNLWVQISYPLERDTAVVETSLGWSNSQSDWKSLARRVTRSKERIFVEYNIPLLRPGEQLGIADPIVYRSSELSAKSKKSTNHSYVIDKVICHVLGENCRREIHKLWLVATFSPNAQEMEEEDFSRLANELLKREGRAMARLFVAIASRLFKLPYSYRSALLRQHDSMKKIKNIAIEKFGQGGTSQRIVDIGLYVNKIFW